MKDILLEVNSPLFDGVNPEDRKTMLGCIGYHIGTFNKEIIEEARSRGDLFFVGFHAILVL